MRDEADLRRLAEMRIDAYAPRKGEAPARGAASTATSAPGAAASVVLLADASTPRANALLAAVARALAFARVASTRADTADERVLAGVTALVAFGDKHARAAGAAMSAQRQGEVAWVVTVEPASLATDPHGKRALWSELKRIARPLTRTNGA